MGARMGDATIMVASGGGYRAQSLLLVYDVSQQLIYQEALENRTYALWADPRGAAFYVGTGEGVYRYNRAEPSGGIQ